MISKDDVLDYIFIGCLIAGVVGILLTAVFATFVVSISIVGVGGVIP